MKKCWMVLSIFLLVLQLHAQTLEEFTQQKKTQIKYLVEQIAALKVYAGYIEKGYDIAQKGLSVINNIKKGDFNLHSDYFASLLTVNPKIKGYAKVADIISVQMSMIKLCKATIKQMKKSDWFSASDLNYVMDVFANLLQNAGDLTSQLLLLTSDGKVQMRDDERLEKIDSLYLAAMDQYSFEQHFSGSIQLLEVQRAKEYNDVQMMRTLQGVHQ